MTTPEINVLQKRIHEEENERVGDVRNAYQRDKARVIHSAAFRRMQGKTQVMVVGEGDFHRTRLTHSIEAAQIGEGLINRLTSTYKDDEQIVTWLKNVPCRPPFLGITKVALWCSYTQPPLCMSMRHDRPCTSLSRVAWPAVVSWARCV